MFESFLNQSVERIKKAKLKICQQVRRGSLSNILGKLSVVAGDQIDIQGNKNSICTCDHNNIDDNCLKSFMEMSMQPMSIQTEYRNTTQIMTSTPVMTRDVSYDHNIFSVARVKKVELHELSPKVSEFHGKLFIFILLYY